MQPLDKKTEQEILKVYHALMEAFYAGEIDKMSPHLHEKVQVIGSAKEEVFRSREAYLKLMTATLDQTAGLVELRNRDIQTLKCMGCALVEEHSDLFVQVEGKWVFYNYFRATTIFEPKGNKWVISYMHTSVPDASAEEGEPLGLARIQKENTELREAVRRRTVELELKNRELEVEAALERIRVASMAMHQSEDLIDVATILHQEFNKLDIGQAASCGFVLIDEKNRLQHLWGSQTNSNLLEKAQLPLLGDHILEDRYQAWKQKKSLFFQKVEGAELEKHLEVVMPAESSSDRENLAKMDMPDPTYFYIGNFSYGYLQIISPAALSPEDQSILPQLARVFEQTYTRFLDLQKAEAQAREAQIETALEKVRSRAMAMRESSELADTAQVLFQQLEVLGIETWAAGFNIWEEDAPYSLSWMSLLGQLHDAFRMPHDVDPSFRRIYAHWKKGEDPIYVEPIGGEELVKHYQYMFSIQEDSRNVLEDLQAKGVEIPEPPSFQVFNAAYFKYGYLMFITYEENPEYELIFQRFAQVFEQSYIRFLDLKKAEEQAAAIQREKTRLEKTLSELQATQTQLIQQEKLASLGQLTAGIAHEIKNPLNFVNNFSEVSRELLEELREEIQKGNWAEVETLTGALELNLTKIYEHGHRADGIVQSMLLHARGGDGQLEPIDLNALVKEYVNLAFHGMRAGKDPINVTIDLDLDEKLGKVPLIVEDFSRVILNLCNNAFDAMRGKWQEMGDASYHPKLSVRTRRSENNIALEVIDNGPGILEEIRDKILQPFFTTKKGTHGTGLGLSISHDIVKAHGGSMEVRSEVGEGASFIVGVPMGGKYR